MEKHEKWAFLIELLDHLRSEGSWCGETHLQKSLYLFSALFEPLEGLDFVLYKHGPYSFELTDHIAHLKSLCVLALVPRPYPYSPSLKEGENAEKLKAERQQVRERYGIKMNYITKFIGRRGVSELERLSTAMYVTKEGKCKWDVNKRVSKLMHYKPHVNSDEARDAIHAIDDLLERCIGESSRQLGEGSLRSRNEASSR